eukprot:9478950-Alexandrium_andersonii.AAC.1
MPKRAPRLRDGYRMTNPTGWRKVVGGADEGRPYAITQVSMHGAHHLTYHGMQGMHKPGPWGPGVE